MGEGPRGRQEEGSEVRSLGSELRETSCVRRRAREGPRAGRAGSAVIRQGRPSCRVREEAAGNGHSVSFGAGGVG